MNSTKNHSKRSPFFALSILIDTTFFLIGLLSVVLFLMVMTGCSKSDPNQDPNTTQETGTIVGSVKDENGNTYPGTRIEVSKGSEVSARETDTNGTYSITTKSVGSYDIEIELPLTTKEVMASPGTVSVQANKEAIVNFVVQPQPVVAHLNFGDVQVVEEILNMDGNTPTSPGELIYAANIFDAPLGKLNAIKAPDGHHITLAEFKTAQGSLMVHCTGDSSVIEVALEGMIPNGTYTFWLAYLKKIKKVGEQVDFMNDFVNLTNPPVGSPSGTENIAIAGADGTISMTFEHASCILTDEVALVIPILYHINGKTFGGGHVPDAEDVAHMLVYFQ